MSVRLVKWLFGREFSPFDLFVQALWLSVMLDGHVAIAIVLAIALNIVSAVASEYVEMRQGASL